MTITLDPPVPPAVRPPSYFRGLARRTAEWTVIVMTVAVTAKVGNLTGAPVLLSAAMTSATAVMLWLATERRPGAVRAVAVFWAIWLGKVALIRHDLVALWALVGQVAIAAGIVAVAQALSDVARQSRRKPPTR